MNGKLGAGHASIVPHERKQGVQRPQGATPAALSGRGLTGYCDGIIRDILCDELDLGRNGKTRRRRHGTVGSDELPHCKAVRIASTAWARPAFSIIEGRTRSLIIGSLPWLPSELPISISHGLQAVVIAIQLSTRIIVGYVAPSHCESYQDLLLTVARTVNGAFFPPPRLWTPGRAGRQRRRRIAMDLLAAGGEHESVRKTKECEIVRILRHRRTVGEGEARRRV
jgi:hypothetical protein